MFTDKISSVSLSVCMPDIGLLLFTFFELGEIGIKISYLLYLLPEDKGLDGQLAGLEGFGFNSKKLFGDLEGLA